MGEGKGDGGKEASRGRRANGMRSLQGVDVGIVMCFEHRASLWMITTMVLDCWVQATRPSGILVQALSIIPLR